MSQRLFKSVLDDEVFLDDEEQRGEYVMNEEGIIYKGSGNYITSMKWDYGQVHRGELDRLCWDRRAKWTGQSGSVHPSIITHLFPSCTV